MERLRCSWCEGDPLYEAYHDREWGVPVTDDRLLYEFLVLEGAQAGLSWLTILRKREGYRTAFDGFDYKKIAEYDTKKKQSLLRNPLIVRNRLKIRAAITNARAFLTIQQQFGSFAAYIWAFVEGRPIHNSYRTWDEIPAFTSLSQKISKDLKNRGFTFVGPTIIYAHMQATGMVNDHVIDCFRYPQIREYEEVCIP
jgi:DNA-3-methyladenine glycosylase I